MHEAEGLLPREVWVWSPPQPIRPPHSTGPCHARRPKRGRPCNVNFGVDWGVDEVLDSLVRAGAVPRTLLVTAACTAERSAEYGPGQRGARYVDWLMTELVPEVEANSTSPRMRPHRGRGVDGRPILFIAAERHPELVDAAICMSPAFGYAGFSYADSLKARVGRARRTLWIDNGTVGLEEQLQPGVDEMAQLADSMPITDHVVKVYEGRKPSILSPIGAADAHEALLVESAWTRD